MNNLHLTEDQFLDVAKYYSLEETIFDENEEGDTNWWLAGSQFHLNMNFGKWEQRDGAFDLELHEKDDDSLTPSLVVRYLEKYFVHPLFPSQNELELFLLEVGREYPLPATTKEVFSVEYIGYI